MDKKREEAIKLLKIIEAEGIFQARLVGGCVRDLLMKLTPKDYDIATTAKPEEMHVLFKKKKLRFLDYGKDHGTLTVLMPHGPVEVTTLREDVESSGRRAKVAFHTDFKSDALRRDFTINAMSQDATGKVYDYFDGLKHLKEKKLLFVGNPEERIQEDYLRILRFFRFQTRFQLKHDKKTLQAVQKHVSGLSQVSVERITKEVDEILQTAHIEKTLEILLETGVLNFVFPGLEKFSDLDLSNLKRVYESFNTLPLKWRSQARIAALFWIKIQKEEEEDEHFQTEKSLDFAKSKLRLSNKEKEVILTLLTAAEKLPNLSAEHAEQLLYVDSLDIQKDFFVFLIVPFLKAIYANFVLFLNKIESILHTEKKFGYRRKDFPLETRELMELLGISQGPLVGEALSAARYAYLNGEWETKQEAYRWLRKFGANS